MLTMLILHLQRSSIHCYKNVTEVTRRINLARTDMNLESTHTCQGALRGTDISRIVWESRYTIADCSRDSGENVTRKLHTIT